ncbi:hypothetical protein OG266_13470 [Streptomyces sp. NBC_00554]|uniref:hypothetical protein n=1 Tax=unclassified Streptomyces TaxID=2593676 RepID=UPI00225A1CF3|nr:hypothetical protein [Streptomyces sp. NBC_00620]MCX4971336.1 hypothetical protein [Streptomyces sp. NBC_00620]WUC49371.1 hypothetical protein OG266_13470 [Streptomyces sp. NBC_00554]
MRLRRVLPVVAALPALLVISACSSDSKESDGKKATPTAEATSSAEAKEAAEAKRIGAMDPKALKSATISGKGEGFEFKQVAKADVEAGLDMKADKAACQPIASLAGGYTHIKAVSVEHRSLTPTEATDATIGSMWLASHSEKNAKLVMSDLRASLKKCDGFKTLGLTYKDVRQLKDPSLGDEAVGYRITNVVGKQSVPMTFTIVRKGGVIAAFYGVNMLTPEKSAIPEAAIEAQLEKLD